MSNPQIIAPVGVYGVDPGLLYEARFRVQRQQDPVDPLNDAVQLGIRWLDHNKDDAGAAIVADLPLVIADGVQQRSARVGLGGEHTPPAGTVYCRPYVACYGDNHLTDVIVIEFRRIGVAGGYFAVTTSTALPEGAEGLVLVNAGGPLTVVLPPSPVARQTLTIKDAAGNALANAITISGGDANIEGAATLALNYDYSWAQLAYSGTQWVQI